MVYATVIMTAKLSILSLYWRLFPTVFMKRGCVILAVFTVMWWIAGVLVDIFQCSPVSKAFDPAMTPGGCISQNAWCMGSKQLPYTISTLLGVKLCLLWSVPQLLHQAADFELDCSYSIAYSSRNSSEISPTFLQWLTSNTTVIIPNIFMDMIMLCLPTFEVSKLVSPCQTTIFTVVKNHTSHPRTYATLTACYKSPPMSWSVTACETGGYSRNGAPSHIPLVGPFRFLDG